ncbi:MAG: hypothetical protein HY343_00305 [Lentisphaerae bacterium]|nr:hypothetical protein [Lentisphaerota bacterium]
MNTPAHIACGACLALALATVSRGTQQERPRVALLAAGSVVLGILSHLLLDLLPHYAWIVHLDWFKPAPFHWLLREAVFGVAVAVPALLLSGRAWPYAALGIFGAVYPDVEKVLSLDFHWPQALVFFGWHSNFVSNRTAGLPPPLLIAFECLLIGVCLLAMWRIKKLW